LLSKDKVTNIFDITKIILEKKNIYIKIVMKKILTLEQIYKLVERNSKRLFEEASKIQQKSDFESVGKGGVNKSEDVKHVLDLFSHEKVGKSKEVQDIIAKCSPKSSTSSDSKTPSELLDAITSSEDIDYNAIGKCAEFYNLIEKYQKEEVFSSGFSDSRIDPNMDTISKLYSVILGTAFIGNGVAPTGGNVEFSEEIVKPKNWENLVNLVIDNLEGGYYHPDMKSSLKGGEKMGSSGETLFGIDRVHGADINELPSGIKFWNYVDENSGWSEKSKGKPKWKWLHMPNDNTLRQYVADMILEAYAIDKKYANVTKEMEDLINSDARLQLHFIYGVWNGMGNFKTLYNSMIRYINENANYTMKDLLKNAVEARRNLRGNAKVIAQSAAAVEKLMSKLG
jgi:hypothetical protein